MQLHTFMPGIDVARRALLGISIHPFRYFRRGEARAKDNNLYPVWSDDTIWKMPGQLCALPHEKNSNLRLILTLSVPACLFVALFPTLSTPHFRYGTLLIEYMGRGYL